MVVPRGPEVLGFATELVDRVPLGRRGFADGTREQQITGVVGRYVVQVGLTGQVPVLDRDDGGFTLLVDNTLVEVRTMTRRRGPVRGHWVHNFYAVQVGCPAHAYVFCCAFTTTNDLEVCGWLPRAEFLRLAAFIPAGMLRTRDDGSKFPLEADNYEVRQDNLRSVRSWSELRAELARVV